MSFKYLRVTTYYPSYLDDFYARNPGIYSASYDEHLARLISEGFGLADFYERHLADLGVETRIIIANAGPLQDAWAREHSLKVKGRKLLLEQLKSLEPDVVFFEDSYTHDGDFAGLVKKEVPSVRLVFSYCCAPLTSPQLGKLGAFDFVLTCSPLFREKFRGHGLKSFVLNHAFESSLIPLLDKDNHFPETDAFFAGSLTVGESYHRMRREIIERVIRRGVDIRIYTSTRPEKSSVLAARRFLYSAARVLKKCGLERLGARVPYLGDALSWRQFPSKDDFLDRYTSYLYPPVYGVEMLKALSRAKIGLNVHIDAAGAYAGNLRMFEVTGAGSCLVTDHKRNICDFFEPDLEVVTYRSAGECVEKIEWLLEHPDERKRIAEAGQARTLRDHNYRNRAEELHGIIGEELRRC